VATRAMTVPVRKPDIDYEDTIPCAHENCPPNSPHRFQEWSDSFFGSLWTCKRNPELLGDSGFKSSKDGRRDIDSAMLRVQCRKLPCRFRQHLLIERWILPVPGFSKKPVLMTTLSRAASSHKWSRQSPRASQRQLAESPGARPEQPEVPFYSQCGCRPAGNTRH